MAHKHRDPAKEKYWRGRLRQWRRSGLSGREFCAAEGLSEPSFYGWRRELVRRDQERAEVTAAATKAPPPAFVKVALAPVPAAPILEVVVADRRVVRVPAGFDADLLRQVLRLLEEQPC